MSDFSNADRLDSTQALKALSGIVLGDHSFDAVLQRATEVAFQCAAKVHDPPKWETSAIRCR